jgi:5'-nucleotidase
MKPLVLLSNDDGYRADGIRLLGDALREVADVIVCAPETEQSAQSHSLTLSRPLRLRDHGGGIMSIDGTPADCVYVALHAGTRVLPRRPDVVVSGMNHGVNLGLDVFYSGTVAAAREAALRGIPAVACSSSRDADFVAACAASRRIVLAVVAEVPRGPLLLNVNFPSGSEWEIRQTRLGDRIYSDEVDFRRDPRGGEYLWIGGSGGPEHRPIPGSDTDAFDEGAASVTPLVLDLYGESHAATTARVVARLHR